jgi:hypothetical protein
MPRRDGRPLVTWIDLANCRSNFVLPDIASSASRAQVIVGDMSRGHRLRPSCHATIRRPLRILATVTVYLTRELRFSS